MDLTKETQLQLEKEETIKSPTVDVGLEDGEVKDQEDSIPEPGPSSKLGKENPEEPVIPDPLTEAFSRAVHEALGKPTNDIPTDAERAEIEKALEAQAEPSSDDEWDAEWEVAGRKCFQRAIQKSLEKTIRASEKNVDADEDEDDWDEYTPEYLEKMAGEEKIKNEKEKNNYTAHTHSYLKFPSKIVINHYKHKKITLEPVKKARLDNNSDNHDDSKE